MARLRGFKCSPGPTHRDHCIHCLILSAIILLLWKCGLLALLFRITHAERSLVNPTTPSFSCSCSAPETHMSPYMLPVIAITQLKGGTACLPACLPVCLSVLGYWQKNSDIVSQGVCESCALCPLWVPFPCVHLPKRYNSEASEAGVQSTCGANTLDFSSWPVDAWQALEKTSGKPTFGMTKSCYQACILRLHCVQRHFVRGVSADTLPDVYDHEDTAAPSARNKCCTLVCGKTQLGPRKNPSLFHSKNISAGAFPVNFILVSQYSERDQATHTKCVGAI